jgi:hypothetical protein
MDGKIEQHVYIKIYVKLSESATKTLEMLRGAGQAGQQFLNGIYVSSPVKCQLR